MALSFNQQKGKAQKSSAPTFQFKDGDNKFRIVGGILPRYVYWVAGANGKNIPLECLSFNREEEAFTNVEKDWVQETYPDLKCSWAYVCQVIDPADGEIKMLNLKKKMWEQICTAAEDLGDPTDIETGWDVVVKRAKTGPLPYNVEYTLKALACKSRPLTDEERLAVSEMKTIDEIVPRQTPEKQKQFIDKVRNENSGSDENTDDSVEEEFDIS